MCRSGAEACREAAQCVKTVSNELVDSNPVSIGLIESPLECTEETRGPRDGNGDEPQFAEVLHPPLVADAFGGGEFFEDGGKSFFPMWREFECVTE